MKNLIFIVYRKTNVICHIKLFTNFFIQFDMLNACLIFLGNSNLSQIFNIPTCNDVISVALT